MALTSYISNLNWLPNGIDTNPFSSSPSDWRAVTWGGQLGDKKFLAVSGNAVIGNSKVSVSSNGYEWTSQVTTATTFFSNTCNKILWDAVYQRFFAVGNGVSTLQISNDATGMSWTSQGNTNVFTTAGHSIASNKKSLRLVAVGKGSNSIAYSDSGTTLASWTGVTGTSIFSDQGNQARWYAIKNVWVAVGQGTNTIATSVDGITWTGRGTSVFSTAGYDVAFNPTKAVAVGAGTNTVAYSLDGLNWYGLGTNLFSVSGNAVTWTGTFWIAVGAGATNTIAYSLTGLNWIGVGKSMFSVAGNGIAAAQRLSVVVAVGEGTNTLAVSTSGFNFVYNPRYSNLFTVAGYGVGWNNRVFVAVGKGTNSVIYSLNGTNWKTSASGNALFDDAGYSVAWSGSNWVAVGKGSSNTAAFSPDGVTWTGLGNLFSMLGRGIAVKLPELVLGGTATSGNANLLYSADATTFTGLNSLYSTPTSLQGNSATPFAVANNGSTSSPLWLVGSTTVMGTSLDGFSWVPFSQPIASAVNSFVYGNSLWVAGGQGASHTLSWSVDGFSWVGVGITVFNSQANSVAFNTNSALTASFTGSVTTTTLTAAFVTGTLTVGMGLGGSLATFTGSITGTSLSVNSGSVSGTLFVGMSLSGTGVTAGTTITAGSGLAWTVSISQTVVASTTFTGSFSNNTVVTAFVSNNAATFTGSITSTTLSVDSGSVTGIISIGMGLTGTGVAAGTVITAGAGLSWTVNNSQNVAAMTAFTGSSSTWSVNNSQTTSLTSGLTGSMTRWAAAGASTNYLAYSNTGKFWTGAGTGMGFSTSGGLGVANNPNATSYATFSGDISGTTLTVATPLTAGTIVIGMVLTGSGVLDNTTILSGSGTTWTVNLSQTVSPAVTMTGSQVNWTAGGLYLSQAQCYSLNNGVTWTPTGKAVFTGAIPASSSTLTVTSLASGVIMAGMIISGTNVPANTRIVSGSGSTWTVSPAIGVTAVTSTTITGLMFSSRCTCVAYNTGATGSAVFSGSISGTTLTVTTVTSGTIVLGMSLTSVTGALLENTTIVSGSGLSWTVNNSQSVAPLTITGSVGKWVAGGIAAIGNVAYSSNGVTWNYSPSFDALNTSNCTALAYSKELNIWVATANSTSGTVTLMYSFDGVNWTGVASSKVFIAAANAVSWNGAYFIATGFTTGIGAVFAYSTTGVNWFPYSVYPNVTGVVNDIGYNSDHNTWIAVGNTGPSPANTNCICYSANGVTWIGVDNNPVFLNQGIGVVWKGAPLNKWVGVGGGTNNFAESPDGVNWFGRGTAPFGSGSPRKVMYTDNKFVAVGQGSGSPNTTISTSPDGSTWSTNTSTANLFLEGRGLDYDAATNKVVVVGDRQNFPFTTSGNGVAYGNVEEALFTGSISSTTLTVTAILSGAIFVGMTLTGAPNTLLPGTTIVAGSGLSWVVNNSQTVASTQLYGLREETASIVGRIFGSALTVDSVTSGSIRVGMRVTGNNLLPNTVISSIASATQYGLNTTYNSFSVTGSISGTTLTLTAISSGPVYIGAVLSGGSIPAGTFITAGSGYSWTVSASITQASTTITSNGFAGDFSVSGTIVGDVLTVNSVTSGVVMVGMRVTGAGVAVNTIITAGSGLSWTVSVGAQNVTPAVALTGTFNQLLTGTNGLFVASGAGTNTLAYSTTGKHWSGTGTSTLSVGQGISFNYGAVGFATFNGTISSSTLTISGAVTGDAIRIGMGIQGNGVTQGTVITAGSGTSWTLNKTSTVSSAQPMIASMRRWVATGDSANNVAYSNDGIIWTQVSVLSTRGYKPAYSPMVLLTGGTGGVSSTTLTVTAVSRGFLYAGMLVTGTGLAAGTTIVTQLTVTGGAPAWTTGTYSLSGSNTVANSTSIEGGNVWVVVGQQSSGNNIAYSLNNGVTWTTNSFYFPFRDSGRWVTFGGPVGQQKFVAVGTTLLSNTNDNCIAYSTDGIVWTGVVNSGNIFATSCNGVAYGGALGQEKFVAVGNDTKNIFAYSLDGVNWFGAGGTTIMTTGLRVIWSATKQVWLAAGNINSSTVNNCFAYSLDGIVWYGASVPISPSSTTVNDVAYGKNVFVSVRTTNGFLFYANEEPANSQGDFNWINITNNTIAVSNDGGTTWENAEAPTTALLNTGNTVVYNGTKWIASGTLTGVSAALLYAGSNAQNWGSFTNMGVYTTKWLSSINKFILAENLGPSVSTTSPRLLRPFMATSSNGVDWTWLETGSINNMSLSVPGSNTTSVFNSFAERTTPSTIIVCCTQGAAISNSINASYVFRSTDGITWTRGIFPLLVSSVLYVPFTVSPRFMAFSGNYMAESANALTWTSTKLFDDRMNSTCAVWSPYPPDGLGKLCVISNSSNFSVNAVATSTDGVTWTYGTIPANFYTTLEWSPSLQIFCTLMGSGNQQQCMISGDGLNWYNTNTLNSNNSFAGLVWSPDLQMFCGVGYSTFSRPYSFVSKLLV
jgi:hypothetical protein